MLLLSTYAFGKLGRAKQSEWLSELLCLVWDPRKDSKASRDREERIDALHICRRERKVKGAWNSAVYTFIE